MQKLHLVLSSGVNGDILGHLSLPGSGGGNLTPLGPFTQLHSLLPSCQLSGCISSLWHRVLPTAEVGSVPVTEARSPSSRTQECGLPLEVRRLAVSVWSFHAAPGSWHPLLMRHHSYLYPDSRVALSTVGAPRFPPHCVRTPGLG